MLMLVEHEKLYDQARGYKPFFMLNSTKHKISAAYKTEIPKN